MSTRRLPLSTNPNAVNSPLRGAATGHAALTGSKRTRSHADTQREEAYGQPPPAKRQMVSPTKSRVTVSKSLAQRAASKAAVRTDHTSQASVHKTPAEEYDNLRAWQSQTRARFPRMVFYFDSIPDDLRGRLAKLMTQYGAREEKFFSIDITHVVTTRPIPTEKTISDESESRGNANDAHEQLKTIDPSLLNRTESNGKKKVLLETTSARRISGQGQEEGIRRPKTRHVDLLHRALEMNKKIWSLEKLQKILEMLGPDAFALSQRGAQDRSNSKQAEQKNLLQLLQNERVHGPSDRDPTVVTKEMHYFKGPYIYVFDIEEKTKPIMVREYAKVADKTKGEWPQFRVVSQGRCPFVEDYEAKEERPQTRPKERVVKAAVEAAAPTLRPPEIPPPKTVVGKRNFAEVEDGHNRGAAAPQEEAFEEAFDLTKIGNHSHGFMSRVRATRFVAGQEPEASGLQRSKATSAIRSQMISSTSGVLGVKAGTSKEFHGLQRKVLQKASTPTVSQDLSSRRLADMSHDSNTFVRSASLGHSHRKLDMVEEMEQAKPKERLRRTVTAPPKVKQKARDPKPGYCENCNDKFEDFDEHILSRKHRRFADNADNWTQLDDLLSQLERRPKYAVEYEEEEEEEEEEEGVY